MTKQVFAVTMADLYSKSLILHLLCIENAMFDHSGKFKVAQQIYAASHLACGQCGRTNLLALIDVLGASDAYNQSLAVASWCLNGNTGTTLGK